MQDVEGAIVEREWRRERLLAAFLSFFGALALVMSCLGIYGMLAYLVNWRTPEIGIRMALGAHRHTVVRMVLRESLLPVAAGLVCGIIAAFALVRSIEAFLFGVSKTDPISIIAASAVLVLTAAAAAFLPALRASRIDPMRALRYE